MPDFRPLQGGQPRRSGGRASQRLSDRVRRGRPDREDEGVERPSPQEEADLASRVRATLSGGAPEARRPAYFDQGESVAARILRDRAALGEEGTAVLRPTISPASALASLLSPSAEAQSRGGAGAGNFQPIIRRFDPEEIELPPDVSSFEDLSPEAQKLERRQFRQEENTIFGDIVPRIFSNLRQVPSPGQLVTRPLPEEQQQTARTALGVATGGLSELGGPGMVGAETAARAIFGLADIPRRAVGASIIEQARRAEEGAEPSILQEAQAVQGPILQPEDRENVLDAAREAQQRLDDEIKASGLDESEFYSRGVRGVIERGALLAEYTLDAMPQTSATWKAAHLYLAGGERALEAADAIEAGQDPKEVIRETWDEIPAWAKAADFIVFDLLIAPDNLLPNGGPKRMAQLQEAMTHRKTLESAETIADVAARATGEGRLLPVGQADNWINKNVPMLARTTRGEAVLVSDEALDVVGDLVAHLDDERRLGQVQEALGRAGITARTKRRALVEVLDAFARTGDPDTYGDARALLSEMGWLREVDEATGLVRNVIDSPAGQRAAYALNALANAGDGLADNFLNIRKLADDAATAATKKERRLARAAMSDQMARIHERMAIALEEALLPGADPLTGLSLKLSQRGPIKWTRDVQNVFARFAHLGYTPAYAFRNGLQNYMQMLWDGMNPFYGGIEEVEQRFGTASAAIRGVGSRGAGVGLEKIGGEVTAVQAAKQGLHAPAVRLSNQLERAASRSIVAQTTQRFMNRYWRLDAAIPTVELERRWRNAGLTGEQIDYLLREIQGSWKQESLGRAISEFFENAESRFQWQNIPPDSDVWRAIRELDLEPTARRILQEAPNKQAAQARLLGEMQEHLDRGIAYLEAADSVPRGSYEAKMIDDLKEEAIIALAPEDLDEFVAQLAREANFQTMNLMWYQSEVHRLADLIAQADPAYAEGLKRQAARTWVGSWGGPQELHPVRIRELQGKARPAAWDDHFSWRQNTLRDIVTDGMGRVEELFADGLIGRRYTPVLPRQIANPALSELFVGIPFDAYTYQTFESLSGAGRRRAFNAMLEHAEIENPYHAAAWARGEGFEVSGKTLRFDEVDEDIFYALKQRMLDRADATPMTFDIPDLAPNPAVRNMMHNVSQAQAMADLHADIAVRGEELLGEMTTAQRDSVARAVDELVRPALDQARAVASGVADEFRNFTLLNYGDRRNVDTYMGLMWAYPYWYSRTYGNWLRRALQGNLRAIGSLYKLDAGLRRLNSEVDVPWFQGQLALGEMFGQQVYIPIQQLISPLSGLTGDKLRDPDRRFSPAASFMDELGQWGPSTHSLIPLIMSLAAKRQGDDEGALAWGGYVGGQPSRFINAMSVLAREIVPGGEKWLPAGGVSVEPGMWSDGSYGGYFLGDKWERRRFGKTLRQMVTDEGLDPEDAYLVATFGPDVGERTGRDELQAIWEDVIQRTRAERAAWTVLSWGAGGGLKGRPESDIEVANMDVARRGIYAMREADLLDDVEYAEAWRQHREDYPFSDLVLMFRGSQADRDEALFWSIYNRLPPRNFEILEAAGVEPALVDRMFEARGDFEAAGMPDGSQERIDFMRAVVTLASMLQFPDDPTAEEWEEARALKRAMDQQLERQFGEEITALRDTYFSVRDSEGATAANQFLEDHPALTEYFDARQQLIMSEDLLQGYYTSIDMVEQYLLAQWHAEMRQEFEDIDVLWDTYHQIRAQDPDAAADYFAAHPELKLYLIRRSQFELERDGLLEDMVGAINALEPQRTPQITDRPPADIFEERLAGVVQSGALELRLPEDLRQMSAGEIEAAIQLQIDSAPRLGDWFRLLEETEEHYDRSLTAFLATPEGFTGQARGDALALLNVMQQLSEEQGWSVPETLDQVAERASRARVSASGGGRRGSRGGGGFRGGGGGGGSSFRRMSDDDARKLVRGLARGNPEYYALLRLWAAGGLDKAVIKTKYPDFWKWLKSDPTILVSKREITAAFQGMPGGAASRPGRPRVGGGPTRFSQNF